MKRKISWTKFKLPQVNNSESLDDDDEDLNPWEEKERGKYGQTVDRLESMISGNKMLQTPLGSIHLDGSEESGRLFNVWAGHVNFNLTPQHYAAMEHIEGVEALQPISRYRFQLAIGYLFDEEEVKKQISDVLVGSLEKDVKDILRVYQLVNNPLPKKFLEKLYKTVESLKNKHWAALVLPNSDIKLIVSDIVDDKFFEEITVLGLAQSLIGGSLESSLLKMPNLE